MTDTNPTTAPVPLAELAREHARRILSASHTFRGYPISPRPTEAFGRECMPILTALAQALGAAIEALTGECRGGYVTTSLADNGTELDAPRKVGIHHAAAIEVLIADDGDRAEVLADTIAALAIRTWRPSR